MNHLQRRKQRLPLLLSFCIPFGVVTLAFCIGGLWPIGDRQIMAHDGWHQYYPFFVAFRDALRSGNGLLYTWSVGMGMDYLGLIAYYLASPLNLVSVLLPEGWLLGYFSLLVPIKLGLAGLFFALFLKDIFRRNDVSIAVFGGLYGLCAWALGYQWNVMWLDTFALLPLVVLGEVKLLRDTVASLRLDCVLAAGFSVSRGAAADLIRGGRTEINWMPCDKPDATVEQGDVLTVRGLGKCRLEEVGGQSRKGRTSVTMKRYL